MTLYPSSLNSRSRTAKLRSGSDLLVESPLPSGSNNTTLPFSPPAAIIHREKLTFKRSGVNFDVIQVIRIKVVRVFALVDTDA
jgi:hypothetical protein